MTKLHLISSLEQHILLIKQNHEEGKSTFEPFDMSMIKSVQLHVGALNHCDKLK